MPSFKAGCKSRQLAECDLAGPRRSLRAHRDESARHRAPPQRRLSAAGTFAQTAAAHLNVTAVNTEGLTQSATKPVVAKVAAGLQKFPWGIRGRGQRAASDGTSLVAEDRREPVSDAASRFPERAANQHGVPTPAIGEWQISNLIDLQSPKGFPARFDAARHTTFSVFTDALNMTSATRRLRAVANQLGTSTTASRGANPLADLSRRSRSSAAFDGIRC